MNLKSVELNNFRLFKGNHKLDLKENDLNVIVGANASGKSSIAEAIRWCLYGISGSSILNFKAAEEDDIKNISVKCYFEDESDDVIVNRSMLFNKDNNAIEGDDFVVMINNEIISNPYSFIEEKFPRFLYDLTNNSLDENIKLLPEIISKRNGVEKLYKINHHLRGLENNYLKQLSKLNPNVLESINMVEKKLLDIENRIEEIEYTIDKTEKRLKFCHQKIRDIPNVNPLIERRDMLLYEKKFLSKNIDDCEKELELILIKELPSYIVFSKGISSLDFEKIESVLSENASQNNELITNYHHLKNSLLNLDDIGMVKSLSERLNMLKSNYVEYEFQLKNIESELTLSIPNNGVYGKMESLKEDLNKLHVERDNLLRLKAKLKNDLKMLSVERMDNLRLEDFNIKIEFIHEVMDSIKELINEINKESIIELTDSINDKLANSISKYDEIMIDENYNVLLSKSGFKINPWDLSAAEIELLNLSLILAVREFDENKFLLIFDTPLMRLDVKGRELLINMLKNDKSQKLLLLNDSEAVNISKDYELQIIDSMEVVINGQ